MSQRLKSDIQRLAARRPGVVALDGAPDPDAILELGALGSRQEFGGGINGPFTETDVTTRQYHPDVAFTTTDGVFTFTVQPIKQIDMTDGDGTIVNFIYGDPFNP